MSDEKYIISNPIYEMKNKSMWAGSLHQEILTLNCLDTNYDYYIEKSSHVEAVLKCVDEIIANACDHCFNRENTIKVSEIKVTTDKSGLISVYNDGNGIPVRKHKSDTKNRYIPEVLFGEVFAGSSRSDRQQGGSLKASVNSLGAKICNVHSKMFMIETADGTYKYKQVFDGIEHPNPPIIEESTENYTRITFMIDYEGFKYSSIPNLEPWLRYRCSLTAMYTKVKVYLNDVKIPISDTSSFIKTIYKKNSFSTCISAPGHPSWDLSIGVEENCRIKQVVIVNGVDTPKGAHIDMVIGSILEQISKLINDDKVVKGDFIKNMILVMACPIVNADWAGQVKDKLAISENVLKLFVLDEAFVRKVASLLIEPYLKKLDSKKNTVSPSLKYIPAKFSAKKPMSCSIMLAEGDSAITMLNKGLGLDTRPDSLISRNYYGTFSVQGVIMNIAREITKFENPDGKIIYQKSPKLRDSVRINQLRAAINLDYSKTYETDEEVKTLNYGKIIICTDEDLDGVGKITPLIMVFLYYFWPALFERGMVYRFKTPLIRVFSGDKKFSYFTEEDFKKDYPNITDKDENVRYYKGLSSHEDDDVVEIFTPSNFNNAIYQFSVENAEECRKIFDIYMGDNPETRRAEMRQDLVPKSGKDGLISIIDETFRYNTKSYKLDAIKRQLPHILDGLTPTRRKIIATAMVQGLLPAPGKKASVKVYQFSADVTKRMNYHHGDTSINSTVIYLGQGFENHRFYPLLTRSGQFGDRHGGEPGQARYIGVYSSQLLRKMFPHEDDRILVSVIDEGQVLEPHYYIPVVPFHILETFSSPSEGWANVTYGRNLDAVINIIKRFIDNEDLGDDFSEIDPKHRNYLPPNRGRNKGELKLIGDKLYSFGVYTTEVSASATKIIITELPIGVLTNSFYERLEQKSIDANGKEVDNQKRKLIKSIMRLDKGEEVYMEIVIENTNMEYINKNWGNENFTSIEHFLVLYTSMSNSNLNFYSQENKVVEFGKNYLAAIKYWAVFRRKAYRDRFERALKILTAKLTMHENILRYLVEFNDNKMSLCVTEKSFNAKVESLKFVKIDQQFLESNGKYNDEYIWHEKLEEYVYGRDASYSYLVTLGSPRDLFADSIEKRKKTIESIKIEIDRILVYLAEDPPGKSVWLKDIDNFKACVDAGQRNNWLKF